MSQSALELACTSAIQSISIDVSDIGALPRADFTVVVNKGTDAEVIFRWDELADTLLLHVLITEARRLLATRRARLTDETFLTPARCARCGVGPGSPFEFGFCGSHN